MSASSRVEIDWLGGVVAEQVADAITQGLTEWGLEYETAAKGMVKPGAGVVTVTYRRSLHAAGPSYHYPADNVKPRRGTPERSGVGGGAERRGNVIWIMMGSGLIYARMVEGWYAPVAGGFAKVRGKIGAFLQRAAKRAGLA